MTRLWLFLLLTALAGCGATAPPSKPKPLRVPSSPYYPLQVGTRWLYQGPDHQLEVRVVKHEIINQIPCALLETYRGEVQAGREHIFAKSDGIYRLSTDGQLITPPLPLLKLPPKKNQRWTVTFEQHRPPLRGVFLMGVEELEVAIGSFTDATVVRERRQLVTLQGELLEDDEPTVAFRYWFARDVGIVKQMQKFKNRKIEYELIKFGTP